MHAANAIIDTARLPVDPSSRPPVCLMIFIAVTTAHQTSGSCDGCIVRVFPVSVSRSKGRRKPSSHAGKRKMDHGMELLCLMPQHSTVFQQDQFSARWRPRYQCTEFSATSYKIWSPMHLCMRKNGDEEANKSAFFPNSPFCYRVSKGDLRREINHSPPEVG